MNVSPSGVEHLIERIVNRQIDIPEGMTAHDMQNWLSGYATCQNDVIDIIESLYKPQKG